MYKLKITGVPVAGEVSFHSLEAARAAAHVTLHEQPRACCLLLRDRTLVEVVRLPTHRVDMQRQRTRLAARGAIGAAQALVLELGE